MRAVNLIPGEQRQGAGGLSDLTGRSGGGALIVLGVIVGLAVMIAMYGSAHHSISSQTGEVAQIKAETSAVEARAGRLTPYANFVSMADQRTETVAQLVQARFDWSHALHELGRVLPAGTSLSALHGTVGASATASSSSSSSSAAASSDACLQHASRQHPGLYAHRLCYQPDRRSAGAPAFAPDGRRQRSAAAELDQGRNRRRERGQWWKRCDWQLLR